jgi:hypothetical protein
MAQLEMKESDVESIDIWIILEIFHKESLERGLWNPWHDKGDRVKSGAMGVQDIHRLHKSINAGR